MRPKSAAELEAKWQSRPWYHEPSGTSGERPHPQDDLNLRLRRVLSWLERAESEYEAQDFDAAFIFYWIAFNAMYGRLVSSRADGEERRQRHKCFETVVSTDSESVIYATIWSVLRDEIERMLENRYVYRFYWDHRNNRSMHRDCCWMASRASSPRRSGRSSRSVPRTPLCGTSRFWSTTASSSATRAAGAARATDSRRHGDRQPGRVCNQASWTLVAGGPNQSSTLRLS